MNESAFYFLTRMPLACLIIVAFAVVMFHSHRQLKTVSYRAFLWMIVCGVLHICASILTEYTVNSADADYVLNTTTVPVWLNDAFHDLYLISLTMFMALFLHYAIFLIEKSRRRRFKALRYVVFSLALACSLLMLFLPIEYKSYATVEKYNIRLYYSMGSKAYCLYVYVAFTMVLSVVLLAMYGKKLSYERRVPLIATVCVLVAISAVQVFLPYVLLTALGVTLIIFGIMLSLENKQQFLKPNSTLYNEKGSMELLKELMVHGGKFKVGVYVFSGNPDSIEDAMLDIQSQLPEKQTKLYCCTVGENLLAVIPAPSVHLLALAQPENLPTPEAGNFNFEVKVMEFDDVHSLSAVTDKFAAYRNEYLERQQNLDELTETLGRNTLTRNIEQMIANGKNFTFLMLDLDTFKSINDVYGHQTGDEVLVKASDAMRTVLRSTDLICRMGGDEFWLVLPGLTDSQRIKEIADNLRVELSEINTKKGKIKLNYSMGARIVDFVKETNAIDFDTVYTDADNALYHAKHLGKGCLVFARNGGGTAQ